MANPNKNIHPQSVQSIYPHFNSFEPKPKKFKSCSNNSNSSYRTHSKSSESTVRSGSISPLKSISSTSIKRMIIFDWDDTLFPTFQFVENRKAMNIETLNKWGCRVYQLLTKYIETFGSENIYIITNAINGWIRYSLDIASQLFQALNKYEIEPFEYDYFSIIDGLLIVHKMKTISARSLYQSQFPNPNHSKIWKQLTFIHYAIKHFWNDNQGIIISIGDSCDEWFASKDCQQFLKNRNSINLSLQRINCKFEPTVDELMTEWDTLILIADQKLIKK